jgi:hypothetical protein
MRGLGSNCGRSGRVELPLKRGLAVFILPRLSVPVSPTLHLQPPVTIWG